MFSSFLVFTILSIFLSLKEVTSCTWIGHCLGDSCETFDDCDGDLVCCSGFCCNNSPSGITTALPTTKIPTIPSPTAKSPTRSPTFKFPTRNPTTRVPTFKTTTRSPTTRSPTTRAPTTRSPTTRAPTTRSPTTRAPTTRSPTTRSPTTRAPTTRAPTTRAPTTRTPTIRSPTTRVPTTRSPTTRSPTTRVPTRVPTTRAPTIKSSSNCVVGTVPSSCSTSPFPACPALLTTPRTGVASITSYMDWPCCCSDTPNYSPTCPRTECDEYSGCDYYGLMAWVPFTMPPCVGSAVSFVSIFDKAHMGSSVSSAAAYTYFNNNFAGRRVRMSITCANGQSVTIDATISDYCADSDCTGCCSQNAGSNNYVLDLEYYTVNRHCPGNAQENGGNSLQSTSTSFTIY